jgi:hypothetical protein
VCTGVGAGGNAAADSSRGGSQGWWALQQDCRAVVGDCKCPVCFYAICMNLGGVAVAAVYGQHIIRTQRLRVLLWSVAVVNCIFHVDATARGSLELLAMAVDCLELPLSACQR